jgi:hypothetical protein
VSELVLDRKKAVAGAVVSCVFYLWNDQHAVGCV